MNSLLFENLLSWSAQISILAIAAAAAACALAVYSRARLYFWQAILAIALMLPAIAPWKQPVLVALPAATPVVLATNGVPVSDVPASTYWGNWGVEPLLMLLAAGAALRLAWMATGLLRLARIRKRAQLLHHPRVAFGESASWYVSDQVSGPVTFGWLRDRSYYFQKMCAICPQARRKPSPATSFFMSIAATGCSSWLKN